MKRRRSFYPKTRSGCSRSKKSPSSNEDGPYSGICNPPYAAQQDAPGAQHAAPVSQQEAFETVTVSSASHALHMLQQVLPALQHSALARASVSQQPASFAAPSAAQHVAAESLASAALSVQHEELLPQQLAPSAQQLAASEDAIVDPLLAQPIMRAATARNPSTFIVFIVHTPSMFGRVSPMLIS